MERLEVKFAQRLIRFEMSVEDGIVIPSLQMRECLSSCLLDIRIGCGATPRESTMVGSGIQFSLPLISLH